MGEYVALPIRNATCGTNAAKDRDGRSLRYDPLKDTSIVGISHGRWLMPLMTFPGHGMGWSRRAGVVEDKTKGITIFYIKGVANE